MQRIGRVGRSHILIVASVFLLLITAYMYASYGQSAYFVAFHKPFHLPGFSSTPKYTPPILPQFNVKASIASQSLSPGATQAITLTETPNRTVSGYVEVWVESPTNNNSAMDCKTCSAKEVYKSDTSGRPTQFAAGKASTFTYTYTLPENLLPGKYEVSYIITSSDTFTDYVVNNNFAEFTVR
jgi:hypothetical protein